MPERAPIVQRLFIREERRRLGGEEGGRRVKDDVVDEDEDDDDDDDCLDTLELLIFHNTPFLPVAWRDGRGKVRAMMSSRQIGTEDVTVTMLPL